MRILYVRMEGLAIDEVPYFSKCLESLRESFILKIYDVEGTFGGGECVFLLLVFPRSPKLFSPIFLFANRREDGWMDR